jgi:hypothetical protein
MVKKFERLDECPLQSAPVILGGETVIAGDNAITAIKWCSHSRGCEQEYGSLVELAGCRLNYVSNSGPKRVRLVKQTHDPQSAVRVVVPPDIADLIPTFMNNRHREAKELAVAAKAEDFTTVDHFAQRMVGSGSMFGFDEITARGRIIRSAVVRRNAHEITQAVSAYASYLAMVRIEYDGHNSFISAKLTGALHTGYMQPKAPRSMFSDQAANSASYFEGAPLIVIPPA